ncbi:hypothetical protein VIN01S_22920 [Vibrio inusitatus NBRC 102082]|uniref:histidine kinase n=1 Tax=Vibrio inusitatus NBRC 102082 TaxID=1219070 RepID=A0A4Y3HWU1_9VIBR|nr:ATP-binding protein [Vibrio inusitatus]GEA51488.1 hypothetical protein VIN01S_22920 [Vibrio inusitatus NBRC 102082]
MTFFKPLALGLVAIFMASFCLAANDNYSEYPDLNEGPLPATPVLIGFPEDLIEAHPHSVESNGNAGFSMQLLEDFVTDIWQNWADENNLEIKLVIKPYKELKKMLNAGEIQIIGTAGPEVEEQTEMLSSLALFDFQARLYERIVPSPDNVFDTGALHIVSTFFPRNLNKAFPLLIHSSDQKFVAEYAENLSHIYTVRWWELEEALKNEGMLQDFKHSTQSVPPLQFNALVHPSRSDLLLKLNRYVRTGGSGQTQANWKSKYESGLSSIRLLVGSYSNRFSDEDELYLAKTPSIKYGYVSSGEKPYFVGTEMFIDGYYNDLMQEVSALSGIVLAPMAYNSYSEALSAVERDEVLLMPGIYKNAQRAQVLDFTAPLTDNYPALVSRGHDSELRDLEGKVIALVAGAYINKFIVERLPNNAIFYFDTTEHALDAVASGSAYAFVGNQLSASFIIGSKGYYNLHQVFLGDAVFEQPTRIAVAKYEPELVAILDKALQEFDDDMKIELASKWQLAIKPPVKQIDQVALQRIIFFLVVIALSLCFLFVYHRVQVKKLNAIQSKLKVALNAAEQAQLSAEHSAKAKSEFLAKMSHEIRTPMNGVLGMAESLGHTMLNNDQNKQLNVLNDSAHNLMSLLNDVLDFSKMEAGQFRLSKSSIHLPRLFQQVVNNFEFNAREKGVQILLDLSPTVIKYRCLVDQIRLLQVLNNLVSNATKFTDKGTVSIKAMVHQGSDTTESHLEINVSDSGIGMSKPQLERLFSPFVQANEDISRQYGGSGLGLSICREIVNAMQGTITVSSEEGRGSTFTLTIPTVLEEQDHIEAQPIDRSSRPSRNANLSHAGLRILLVEDNTTNQIVMRGQLKRLGLECDVASNGLEGLQLFQEGNYNLILTDYHMPIMDGIAMGEEIRSQRPDNDVYMAILTADVMQGTVQKFESAGFNNYLFKPYSLLSLQELLVKAIVKLGLEPLSEKQENEELTAASINEDTTAQGWATGSNWLSSLNDDDKVQPSLTANNDGFSIEHMLLINDNDHELVMEAIQDFVDAWPEQERHILRALEEGKRSDVKDYAHKLKGALLYLGCDKLVEKAQHIESESHKLENEVLSEQVNVLISATQALIIELKQTIIKESH